MLTRLPSPPLMPSQRPSRKGWIRRVEVEQVVRGRRDMTLPFQNHLASAFIPAYHCNTHPLPLFALLSFQRQSLHPHNTPNTYHDSLLTLPSPHLSPTCSTATKVPKPSILRFDRARALTHPSSSHLAQIWRRNRLVHFTQPHALTSHALTPFAQASRHPRFQKPAQEALPQSHPGRRCRQSMPDDRAPGGAYGVEIAE